VAARSDLSAVQQEKIELHSSYQRLCGLKLVSYIMQLFTHTKKLYALISLISTSGDTAIGLKRCPESAVPDYLSGLWFLHA
jgi:hypothetical protein